MRHRLIETVALAAWVLVSVAAAAGEGKALAAKADHSQFKVLQQDFQSGPEVTRACLTCHTEAAKQIHRTQHWKWEYVNPVTKQVLGKRHVVNNYCTSAAFQPGILRARAISATAWKDESFDFTSRRTSTAWSVTTRPEVQEAARTGRQRRRAATWRCRPGSGKIVKAIDLKAHRAARRQDQPRNVRNMPLPRRRRRRGQARRPGQFARVARRRRSTCTWTPKATTSRASPATRPQDHQVPGQPLCADRAGQGRRARTGQGRRRATPSHARPATGRKPHKEAGRAVGKLNDHTDRRSRARPATSRAMQGAACRPRCAWDWSTAGQRGPDGKPLIRKDAEGQVVYIGTKGDFVIGRERHSGVHLVQRNGEVHAGRRQDRGSNGQRGSDQPVRRQRGRRQIADLAGKGVPRQAGVRPRQQVAGGRRISPARTTRAYWTNLELEKAVAAGMAASTRLSRCKVDFIETESMWPITHMVAPAKDALQCKPATQRAAGSRKCPACTCRDGQAITHRGSTPRAGCSPALMLLGVMVHGVGRRDESGRGTQRKTSWRACTCSSVSSVLALEPRPPWCCFCC